MRIVREKQIGKGRGTRQRHDAAAEVVLRDQGFRLTGPRRAVLEVVRGTESHPAAERVHRLAWGAHADRTALLPSVDWYSSPMRSVSPWKRGGSENPGVGVSIPSQPTILFARLLSPTPGAAHLA